MKVGLVSDTHDRVLPGLHSVLDGVDEILHCGDLCSEDVLLELETIARVAAVHGNMDDRRLAERLPVELLLEREGIKIALLHGHALPRLHLDELIGKYRVIAPDLVVFGHSHEILSREWEGTRYFNPGTAGGIGADPTCGMLEIDGEAFSVEHVAIAPAD